MKSTPKGNRIHIGIFGRTNTGKSSLLNLATGQEVAIASSRPGTTTDVVEKAMELLPLGPVLFMDTAGLDDGTELGSLRQERTERAFSRADIALLVLEAEKWGEWEELILTKCRDRKIPLIAVVNKCDLATPSSEFIEKIGSRADSVICASSGGGAGPFHASRERLLAELKRAMIKVCSADLLEPPALVSDLLPKGGVVVLVVPIDREAPKGRLILPQVQTIRGALDGDQIALVTKDRELRRALSLLRRNPDLVICDSQAIDQVMADVPEGVACTTFSILFARAKGDFLAAAAGAARLARLRPGQRVLIAEACTHHAVEDDIGRVKIPRWLEDFVGGELEVDVNSGPAFPVALERYDAIIHCGGCTLNRREMLNRTQLARGANVPITNYGMAIAVFHGWLERALTPFPEALRAYREGLGK